MGRLVERGEVLTGKAEILGGGDLLNRILKKSVIFVVELWYSWKTPKGMVYPVDW